MSTIFLITEINFVVELFLLLLPYRQLIAFDRLLTPELSFNTRVNFEQWTCVNVFLKKMSCLLEVTGLINIEVMIGW